MTRSGSSSHHYYNALGGLPGQQELLSGRAVFTEAYAVIPRGVMTDIVTSALPHWRETRAWIIARPLSGFAETFAQYIVEVAPGGGSDPQGGGGVEVSGGGATSLVRLSSCSRHALRVPSPCSASPPPPHVAAKSIMYSVCSAPLPPSGDTRPSPLHKPRRRSKRRARRGART